MRKNVRDRIISAIKYAEKSADLYPRQTFEGRRYIVTCGKVMNEGSDYIVIDKKYRKKYIVRHYFPKVGYQYTGKSEWSIIRKR